MKQPTEKQIPSILASRRLANGIVLLTVCAAIATAYSFTRVGVAGRMLSTVNKYYSPSLSVLGTLSGKLASYRKGLDHDVLFKRWGEKGLELPLPRINLKRMVEPDLERLKELSAVNIGSTDKRLDTVLGTITHVVEVEAVRLAELAIFVKNRNYQEAARLFMLLKGDHRDVAYNINQLTKDFEIALMQAQMAAEKEASVSNTVLFVAMFAALLAALLVGLKLRRILVPILAWREALSKMAVKIAQGGFSDLRDSVDLPETMPGIPQEVNLLTRDIYNMATTAMEHERTIKEQTLKLEGLNKHLMHQNLMLRKLGSLNERILNAMKSGIIVVNSDGVVEQFNDRFCALFNIKKEVVLGARPEHLLTQFSEALAQQWVMGTPQKNGERIISKDGRYFEVNVQMLPQYDKAVRAGFVLSFTDVTELVRSEERLAHAAKVALAGNLSAQVAHELRNPLNSMTLQLELLQEDCEALPKVRNRIIQIQQQVERLERLTDKYLGVHHTKEYTELTNQSFDLHSVIERVITFFSPEIQLIGARIDLELAKDILLVSGDQDQITQVLMNLMTNAVYAIGQQKEGQKFIKISTSTDAIQSVSVIIEDSGPGVAEHIKAKLFEPFVTANPQGHGLGLSLARRICHEHGGDLRYNGHSSFEVLLSC